MATANRKPRTSAHKESPAKTQSAAASLKKLIESTSRPVLSFTAKDIRRIGRDDASTFEGLHIIAKAKYIAAHFVRPKSDRTINDLAAAVVSAAERFEKTPTPDTFDKAGTSFRELCKGYSRELWMDFAIANFDLDLIFGKALQGCASCEMNGPPSA